MFSLTFLVGSQLILSQAVRDVFVPNTQNIQQLAGDKFDDDQVKEDEKSNDSKGEQSPQKDSPKKQAAFKRRKSQKAGNSELFKSSKVF
jgi:protein-disulfide isomerase-like protein with CxxC motif